MMNESLSASTNRGCPTAMSASSQLATAFSGSTSSAVAVGLRHVSRLEQSPGNVEAALRHYDTARVERANRTKAKSLEMLHVFHHPALAQSETAWPYIEQQWSAQAMRERYDWLLSYDATTVEI